MSACRRTGSSPIGERQVRPPTRSPHGPAKTSSPSPDPRSAKAYPTRETSQGPAPAGPAPAPRGRRLPGPGPGLPAATGPCGSPTSWTSFGPSRPWRQAWTMCRRSRARPSPRPAVAPSPCSEALTRSSFRTSWWATSLRHRRPRSSPFPGVPGGAEGPGRRGRPHLPTPNVHVSFTWRFGGRHLASLASDPWSSTNRPSPLEPSASRLRLLREGIRGQAQPRLHERPLLSASNSLPRIAGATSISPQSYLDQFDPTRGGTNA